jgi:hypothetical protein
VNLRIENRLVDAIRRKVVDALKELIEGKHLYQSIEIATADLSEIVSKGIQEHEEDIKRAGPNPNSPDSASDLGARNLSEELQRKLTNLLKELWSFETEVNEMPGAVPIAQRSRSLAHLKLAPIRVSCSNGLCKGSVQPHNSGYTGLQQDVGAYELVQCNPIAQVISIPFQCQNCKGEPVVFLVKRDGMKITLVGRSQFPQISVPKYIPEAQQKFYRSAIIADQTTFILAAALYLRTLIEQYFYQAVPEAQIKAIKGNPTGDELANLYAKTLPQSFPGHFPSLKKAYDDLSRIVHSGKEDAEAKVSFQAIRKAVEGHFEAVQLFRKMPTQ